MMPCQTQTYFAPKFYPGSTQEETEEQKQIAEVLDQSLWHGLITDKTIVAVEVIPDGNTSAVYKLMDDGGDAIVLKTGWSTAWSHDVLAAEAVFLERWRSCGVNTPVVIDPTPALTHPYLCLAFNLILDEMHNGFASDHRLAGYSEVTTIVPKVLAAAAVVKSCLMFPSWGKDRESAYARNLLALYRRTLNAV